MTEQSLSAFVAVGSAGAQLDNTAAVARLVLALLAILIVPKVTRRAWCVAAVCSHVFSAFTPNSKALMGAFARPYA